MPLTDPGLGLANRKLGASRAAIHPGRINALATAELAGVPVVISAGDDASVLVWDPATDQPVGEPFTGHSRPVNALATAELAGVPVVISAGDDASVLVWDPATDQLVGEPFTGHSGRISALSVTRLGGHTAVVSAGDDRRVLVWDLAARSILAEISGFGAPVRAVAVSELGRRHSTGVRLVVAAGDQLTVGRVTPAGGWEQTPGPALGSAILAVCMPGPQSAVIATSLGIAALSFPR